MTTDMRSTASVPQPSSAEETEREPDLTAALTAAIRRRRRRSTTAVWIIRAVLLASVMLGWWQLGRTGHWTLLVGSPAGVWEQLTQWVRDPVFWDDLQITLLEAALGYVLGVTAAVVVVSVIVPIPWLARFTAPFIAIANALPKIVLAPIFILWVGYSIESKVLFVASGIFFVVFYGVYAGIRSVDNVLVDNLRLLGANQLGVIWQVYTPSIIGWLTASLRLSSAWALTAAVLSEYLGANQGIGFRIAQGQQLLDPDWVLAGILVIAVVATTVDRALILVESRFTQWRVF